VTLTRPRRTALWIAVLATLHAQPALAQDCFKIVSRRLALGDSITATLKDGSIVPGHYAGFQGQSLLIRDLPDAPAGFQPRLLALESLRDVRFREKTRPAVLYAVGGFLGGAIIGASIAAAQPGGGELRGVGIAASGLLGGVAGLVVGLVFPLRIPYARLVECN